MPPAGAGSAEPREGPPEPEGEDLLAELLSPVEVAMLCGFGMVEEEAVMATWPLGDGPADLGLGDLAFPDPPAAAPPPPALSEGSDGGAPPPKGPKRAPSPSGPLSLSLADASASLATDANGLTESRSVELRPASSSGGAGDPGPAAGRPAGKRKRGAPDAEADADDQREKRLKKNRASAALSRERKKAALLGLQHRVKELENQNAALNYLLGLANQEVLALRAQVSSQNTGETDGKDLKKQPTTTPSAPTTTSTGAGGPAAPTTDLLPRDSLLRQSSPSRVSPTAITALVCLCLAVCPAPPTGSPRPEPRAPARSAPLRAAFDRRAVPAATANTEHGTQHRTTVRRRDQTARLPGFGPPAEPAAASWLQPSFTITTSRTIPVF